MTWDEIRARRVARNFLARPASRTRPAPRTRLVEVVRAVCGIQAQMMGAAELDLSARVAGLTAADVRRALWQDRTLVKTYGPRGTLHLLPADELPLWMAAMRARDLRDETPWYSRLAVERERAGALVEAIGDALDGKQLRREELADAVGERVGAWAREGIASAWADPASAQAAFHGQLCFGPSEGSRVTFVRADQWLGRWETPDPEDSLRELVRRYLYAYGPATPLDFGEWFALKPPAAHALFRDLAANPASPIEPVEVEGKRAWRLASDNRRVAAQAPTLRLVPQYDCYVLGARFGRDRVIPGAARKRIMTYGRGRFEGAVGVPVLLSDGIVAGIWSRTKRGKGVALRVEPFFKLTAAHERALQAEGERIGAFLGVATTLSVGPL